MMLAEEVPESLDHMVRYALAVVRHIDDSFVLPATERNLLTFNFASAASFPDHIFAILPSRCFSFHPLSFLFLILIPVSNRCKILHLNIFEI